jgi:hypothetical protein
MRVSPRTNIADWYATMVEEAKPAGDAHGICRNVTPKASPSRIVSIIARLRTELSVTTE